MRMLSSTQLIMVNRGYGQKASAWTYKYANGRSTLDYILHSPSLHSVYESVLGDKAFFHSDHRPEYASLNGSLKMRTYPQIKKPRPFWLLPEPLLLLKKNNRLYHRSIIRFSMGPERIEAGWWDGADIQRDYYIGIDKIAGSLWIYHDLKGKQLWYLHGPFG